MTPAVDYIAAPFRELPPLGWRQILDARREVDAELRKDQLGLAWHLEWGPASEMVRSWWQRFEAAFDEAWTREREIEARRGVRFPDVGPDGEPIDRPVTAAGAEVLKELPDEVWAHGLRLPDHLFRPDLICGNDDCDGTIRPTGTRGPLPKLCPRCREQHARERSRARVRKHRQRQWVLARFECLNADGELREHTIVDLDLKCERPPDDDAGRWLDERATWWLERATGSPEWRAFAALEDAAMVAAAH